VELTWESANDSLVQLLERSLGGAMALERNTPAFANSTFHKSDSSPFATALTPPHMRGFR